MFLKYINSNRNSVIILFLLLPVIYWIPSLFHLQATQINVIGGGVPLGRLVSKFNGGFPVLGSLIALLLIMVNGNLLNQLNTVHIFIPFRTQLPLFFYTILTLSVTQLHMLSPALVASSLLIFVFYRVFKVYRTDKVSINFLDAGLLISLASLFFFPAAFFLLFLIITIVLIRPFMWREYAYSVIGFLIPYFFLISIYYLADIPVKIVFTDISASFVKVPANFRLSQIVSWSYILVCILVTSYYMARAIDTMKIHARKFFLVFLSFFLISMILFLTVPGAGVYMIYFISIPLAYLFSYYFFRCKRNYYNEVLLVLLVLLWLYQRIA